MILIQYKVDELTEDIPYLDIFSCFLHTKIISFLLRVGSLLCQVCHTIPLVPVCFWRTGRGLVVKTLGIIAGGRIALRLWGRRSLLGSSIWRNALITSNYPDASARRHVLMFPPYKNNMIFIQYKVDELTEDMPYFDLLGESWDCCCSYL